jgi:hypothetical protein
MSDFQTYPMFMTHIDDPLKTRIVRTPAEEERAADEGFVRPGQQNPAAYLRAEDHIDADAEPEEWPKFLNGKIVQDPNAPPPSRSHMYPLMRDGKIIQTEEDDIALLMEADEDMRVPAAERADERDDLIRRATELGLRFDGRWGLARLREVVKASERSSGVKDIEA